MKRIKIKEERWKKRKNYERKRNKKIREERKIFKRCKGCKIKGREMKGKKMKGRKMKGNWNERRKMKGREMKGNWNERKKDERNRIRKAVDRIGLELLWRELRLSKYYEKRNVFFVNIISRLSARKFKIKQEYSIKWNNCRT